MLSLSARRFCNLVLHWMMEHTDGEVWDKDYKDLFFGDPKIQQAKSVSQAKLAPAVPGQQGSLNIKKTESKPVTDISQFLGRVGDAGKADPNKAVLAAKAKLKAPIKIGPDDKGNLSVDEPQ